MFWSKKTIWNLSTMLMTVAILLVIGIGNAKADFIFGEPVNLGPTVNSSSSDPLPSISADGLELYFESYRSDGFGNCDIWVTTRATTDDEWGEATNLGRPINSSGYDGAPCISPDGLMLYFGTERAGIMVTSRATKSDNWGSPVALGPAVNNSSADAIFTAISSDGLELYLGEYEVPRPGGSGKADLWVSTRSAVSDAWGSPVNLGPTVNSWAMDRNPSISADGLSLFFNSGRGGPVWRQDIWITKRVTKDDDWDTPVNLGPTINSTSEDSGPSISADGRTLYFHSNRPGGYGEHDLWQVSIDPVVDLNADRIVDSADVCIMVEYWGTDEPLCDIGPTPFGDGVVDVHDLIVIAEHLLEDYRLMAHWKLDETEGATAYDIARGNDGFLFNDPVWLPAEGKKDGALQFDGINDYVVSVNVLNPADGPFSVIAWIKGGAPGQVIIAQTDGNGAGENWLSLDAIGGNLMTGLVSPPVGRYIPQPLVSQTVITDGQWHHIGFVWDGSYRSLYVDGIEVAKDINALAPLKYSNGGLYIGAGKALDAGTFFSGLIDDVRIYDVALSAEEIEALAQ